MNPLEATDPWQWLLIMFNWALWLLALVGGLILLFAIVVGIIHGIRGWFSPKVQPSSHLDDYMAEATVVSRGMYKDQPNADWRVECFRAGARWGWGFHNRK